MQIRTREKSILTIEDPVEYQVEGIKQVQVNERTGLTFATGLRSMMRADPDVIMVGEIRDTESALIGIEAALTGHLVLSSLHTNDAPSSLTRLVEMGIEPFLVASSIECRRGPAPGPPAVPQLPPRDHRTGGRAGRRRGLDAASPCTSPVGCDRCAGTGYRGRIGLFEVMVLSDEIRALVVERHLGRPHRRGRGRAGHDDAARRRAWPRSPTARPRWPRSAGSPASSVDSCRDGQPPAARADRDRPAPHHRQHHHAGRRLSQPPLGLPQPRREGVHRADRRDRRAAGRDAARSSGASSSSSAASTSSWRCPRTPCRSATTSD